MNSKIWLVSAALLGVVACASGGGGRGKSSPSAAQANSASSSADFDPERFAQEIKEENEIGRLMAAKLAGHLGSYESDQKLLKYVNLVGKTVAARGNRPELNYRFGILKTEEVNAFATPGGYIFVTLGLLRQLRSESELAGVLGHEVDHVIERHMYKDIMPKRDVSAGETITRMLSRGGADIGYSAGKIVNAGMDMLLEKGLGAEKEHAADQGGTLLAASAGYDPLALEQFLTRLKDQSATVKVSKTHPPFPKRLSDLDAFIRTNGLAGMPVKRNAEEIDTRFKAALANLTKSTK